MFCSRLNIFFFMATIVLLSTTNIVLLRTNIERYMGVVSSILSCSSKPLDKLLKQYESLKFAYVWIVQCL
jgi:hypothetical protein